MDAVVDAKDALDRAEPGRIGDEAALAEYLAPKVPRYKMPKRFFFWDSLPKSGYGKIPKRLIKDELEARGLVTGEGVA